MVKIKYFNIFLFVILLTSIILLITKKKRECFNSELCKFNTNYKKIDNRKPFKVYISFTTTPTRIDKCEDMIISWMKQSYIPDKIWCNISEVYNKTGERYVIPEWFSKYPILEVNKADRDYGPITKFLPSITNTRRDENILFIVCDDDQMYLPHTVEEHINHYEKDKKCYTVSALRIKNKGIDIVDKNGGEDISIPEGYCSYSIHRSVIDKDDFKRYVEEMIPYIEARLSDDLLVGNYLHKIGIEISIISTEKVNRRLWWEEKCILEYGLEGDALHKGGGYNIVDNYISQTNNAINYSRYLKTIDILKSKSMFYLK